MADQFQKKSWANKLSLRRKLFSLKLNEGQSVQSHMKAMTEVFDELSIVGDPLTEEDKVVHLLASLPSTFDMLVTALEANPEVPKMEVVMEMLLHEETKQRSIDKAESNDKVKAMAGTHRSPNKKRLKCYHCGIPGHIKRDCFELQNDNSSQRKGTNKSKQKACAAGGETDDEEIVGLYAGKTSNTRTNIMDWIIDSGASCHMCKDKSAFKDLEE